MRFHSVSDKVSCLHVNKAILRKFLKEGGRGKVKFVPTTFYLTIRLLALNFYEVIVEEDEARINYHLIEIKSE